MSAPSESHSSNASPVETALRALVRLLARQAAREHLASASRDTTDKADEAGGRSSRAEAER